MNLLVCHNATCASLQMGRALPAYGWWHITLKCITRSPDSQKLMSSTDNNGVSNEGAFGICAESRRWLPWSGSNVLQISMLIDGWAEPRPWGTEAHVVDVRPDSSAS